MQLVNGRFTWMIACSCRCLSYTVVIFWEDWRDRLVFHVDPDPSISGESGNRRWGWMGPKLALPRSPFPVSSRLHSFNEPLPNHFAEELRQYTVPYLRQKP